MARIFSNFLEEYVKFTENSEAPELFHFWTGVSAIASCLRRKVWINMHNFKWTPNFYIIMVAPPGISTKSTTASIAEKMLRQVDGVKFGPQSTTWQALTVSLEEAREVVEHETFPSGFSLMSAITLNISELGTFLKTKDGDLIDVLTDMWDGRDTVWQHKTKTTGQTDIINPWLNVIGCTTPGWMRQNFPNYMIEGGFTSRVIFLWSDKKRRLIPYPDEFVNQTAYDAKQAQLVHDLQEIANLVGPYKITDEARVWGRSWYEAHWANKPRALISDRYGGYLARKQTHIHKLAIILSAAKRNELYIGLEDLMEAARIVTALEGHMQKVFDTIGLSDLGKVNTEVLSYFRVYKEMKFIDLYKALGSRIDKKDLEAAISSLCQVGTLRQGTLDGAIAYQLVDQRTELDGIVEG